MFSNNSSIMSAMVSNDATRPDMRRGPAGIPSDNRSPPEADPNEMSITRWPSALPYDTEPLCVDPQRENGETGETGIFDRAMREGRPGSYDIATLDRDSLFRWLRSRGGANPWAENVVATLLGHKL